MCKAPIPLNRPRDRFKKFCSHTCSGRYYKPANYIDCPVCNTTFQVLKGVREIYCSVNCYNKTKISTYTKKCEFCNKEFILHNKAYEKRGAGRFCSSSCSSRKYKVNEDFFKTMLEKPAYWLGFIYADGHNSGTELRIKLSSKDSGHLEYFKKHIKCEHLIKTIDNKSYIHIGSKKICSDLNHHGAIFGKKFDIIKLPILPRKMYKHFIRGYFDGDGCFYVSKKNHGRINIHSSSTVFISELRRVLLANGIKTTGDGINLNVCNKDNLQKLYHYFYDDSTVYLDRKYKKYKHYLEDKNII